jgi:hypothetical protein
LFLSSNEAAAALPGDHGRDGVGVVFLTGGGPDITGDPGMVVMVPPCFFAFRSMELLPRPGSPFT